ncbi:gliding motility-associated C-terminal domain-containing protein [Halosquirtibacter laminarini]|uniref:Gliding motility-associated C-terminal domain-containing protein n=1 Tax=Halosquirtibacter laminarini TaxID=3374600 RepID=A0AC61NP64_9BACT|nr:gliding motility-associated C-terminal domain-containing protein [Prolixibacteraceae bacterium]
MNDLIRNAIVFLLCFPFLVEGQSLYRANSSFELELSGATMDHYEWIIDMPNGKTIEYRTKNATSGILQYSGIGKYHIYVRGKTQDGCYSNWIDREIQITPSTLGIEDQIILYRDRTQYFSLNTNDKYLKTGASYKWCDAIRRYAELSKDGKIVIYPKVERGCIPYQIDDIKTELQTVIIQTQPYPTSSNRVVCNSESYILRGDHLEGDVSKNDYSTFQHRLKYTLHTLVTKQGNCIEMNEHGVFHYKQEIKTKNRDSFYYTITDLLTNEHAEGCCYIYPTCNEEVHLDDIFILNGKETIEDNFSENDNNDCFQANMKTIGTNGIFELKKGGHFVYKAINTKEPFIDKAILSSNKSTNKDCFRCYIINIPRHQNFTPVKVKMDELCYPYEAPLTIKINGIKEGVHYEVLDSQRQPLHPKVTIVGGKSSNILLKVPSESVDLYGKMYIEASQPEILYKEIVGEFEIETHRSLDFDYELKKNYDQSTINLLFSPFYDAQSTYTIYGSKEIKELIAQTQSSEISIPWSNTLPETIYVIREDQQCESQYKKIDLSIEDFNKVRPYNTITPNGDGLNDKWIIQNIEWYPHNKVFIFNRWGKEIIQIENYNNTTKVWDGKTRGQKVVTDGTVYYLIEIPNYPTLKGWLLIRGGSND